MIKRHEDALAQRIDEVAEKGFSYIEWWELALWLEKERIGKGVWKDLYDRFKERTEDDPEAELYIYSAGSGAMLIHSDGLRKVLPNGDLKVLKDEKDSP